MLGFVMHGFSKKKNNKVWSAGSNCFNEEYIFKKKKTIKIILHNLFLHSNRHMTECTLHSAHA